ncbi:aspartate kinase [Thermosediminibacter oceani]|uniref:Aspartokinase n=1 Tax=Thermosediminibacter oceani (strain ATCC BAA-1034 / DSM 16646 / JW/IW-1228P) TaxID=555079 RepID=D9S1X0_THEOJ|nr:aspartate kinase [Thermosediminibacter oceani]ADL07397.1 aspartate kinase [Thermosediminibacter oceani DSM 16646]
MKLVVQKFGGTSVATPKSREMVLKHVIRTKREGYSPVVVVSAIGRRGDPYATDTLLSLLEEVGGEVPARERDLLMSCGEIISAALVAALLNAKGHPAKAFTGGQAGIITDDRFGNAAIKEIKTDVLIDAVKQGYIPVVAGFQGITENGDITTLGRGGSDTTAVALGAALGAECVDIFTDVEGIMTADPRIVKGAHILDTVTYREVTEMAYNGARVIHPKAVEIAMQRNIPVRVRSTFSDSPGTLITCGPERLITGIAHIPHLAQICIKVPSDDRSVEVRIFRMLADAGISIDLINLFPDLKVFTIKEELVEKAVGVLEGIGVIPEVVRGLAKVTVVGAGMRGVPGVMARIIEALEGENIEILQTSDSHTTISCLVRDEDAERAITALHKKFEL